MIKPFLTSYYIQISDLKPIAFVIIALLLVSVVSFPDAFAGDARKKMRFWGTHDMELFGDPQIDFKVNQLVEIQYNVTAKVNVGNYKTVLTGEGFLQPTYGYYDRQCKSLTGHENLNNTEGDSLRIDYFGKVCYIGSNMKLVNMYFKGSQEKGIFENAIIEGTLTGTSDRYESNYNLSISSIITYLEN